MPKKVRKCIGTSRQKGKYKLWKQSQIFKFGEIAFLEKEAEKARLRRQIYREKFGKIKKPKLTPAELANVADVKRQKAAEKMRLKRQSEEHIFINSDQFGDTKISVADVRRRIAAERMRLKRQSEKNNFINSEQFEETKISLVDIKADKNSEQFEASKISVADVKRKIAAEKMRLKRQSEEKIISVADVKRQKAAEKKRLQRQSEEHIFISSDQNSDQYEETKISVAEVKRKKAAEKMRLKRQYLKDQGLSKLKCEICEKKITKVYIKKHMKVAHGKLNYEIEDKKHNYITENMEIPLENVNNDKIESGENLVSITDNQTIIQPTTKLVIKYEKDDICHSENVPNESNLYSKSAMEILNASMNLSKSEKSDVITEPTCRIIIKCEKEDNDYDIDYEIESIEKIDENNSKNDNIDPLYVEDYNEQNHVGFIN